MRGTGSDEQHVAGERRALRAHARSTPSAAVAQPESTWAADAPTPAYRRSVRRDEPDLSA